MCYYFYLDWPIYSFLHSNIDKAVDLLVHEVVFINYFSRDQADGNIVVFMLHHDVVKLKVLGVNHEVPGAWGRYDTVAMHF